MKKITLFIGVLILFGLNEAIGQWNTSGNNIYNTNSGNVGIGTSAPGYLLHVSKNMTSPSIRIQNAGGAGGAAFEMIDNLSGADWKFKATNAGGFKIRDHANGLDVIQVEPNSAANTIYIASGGDVGINTSDPYSRFEVATDAYTTARLGYLNITPHYFYHMEIASEGYGQSALWAYRTREAANNGISYSNLGTNQALKGTNFWGDQWTFGVCGHCFTDYTRTGGVLGANSSGLYWGSLGYKNNASTYYGGYFTSYTAGTGKSSQSAFIGIGIGAWGDLLGADIHGKVYGAYMEGENYASYSHGPVYKDDVDVHLQENGTETKTVLYTYVSTDISVQTRGTASLTDGMANIVFDPAFTSAVSIGEPIVITVTPTGNSNGVFLSEVTSSGFTVVENNAGRSNVTVNFIAIGTRAGYENPSLAKEVIDAGYTRNITRGLTPDADLQNNGEGLYYENGKLVIGIHPSALPDPNRQSDEFDDTDQSTR